MNRTCTSMGGNTARMFNKFFWRTRESGFIETENKKSRQLSFSSIISFCFKRIILKYLFLINTSLATVHIINIWSTDRQAAWQTLACILGGTEGVANNSCSWYSFHRNYYCGAEYVFVSELPRWNAASWHALPSLGLAATGDGWTHAPICWSAMAMIALGRTNE